MEGGVHFDFHKYDYGVSFVPFLQSLPLEYQGTPTAMETNRCLFLVLGISTGLHPFLLAHAFRYLAQKKLNSDDMYDGNEYREGLGSDLNSITSYADLTSIDSVLKLFWPTEFNDYTICVITIQQGYTRIANVYSSTRRVSIFYFDYIF